MKNRHMHLDEQRRQEDAVTRQEQRNKRTVSEQLALIAKRPGNSQREFDRLMKETIDNG